MLLRVRISLLVLLALLVVGGGLSYLAFEHERLVREQLYDIALTDRAIVWEQLQNHTLSTLEDAIESIDSAAEVAPMLAAGDLEAIQAFGSGYFRKHGGFVGGAFIDRFEIIGADGELLYSSTGGVLQSSIISEAAVAEALQSGAAARGVGNDRQGNIGMVLGLPIVHGGEPVGMAVYASDFTRLLSEFQNTTKSLVLLANRRGRLLKGTEQELWDQVSGEVNLTLLNTMQQVEVEGRVYWAVVSPQVASLGTLAARLVGIQDVTAQALRQQRLSRISLLGAVAFMLLVIGVLNFYIHRAFAPLTEGVDVLNALSRGDLRAQIDQVGRSDEVGRIAAAVNLLRESLIAFHSFQRSRERQRFRQERFIRQQLTRLADTLDDEEREAVVAEMADLEFLARRAREDMGMSLGDTQDSAQVARRRETDSLAMTARAFLGMSERVQDQNQRLRDALKAKNAFVALQRELDIAARVQLSLLPGEAPASELFAITGTMKPAKEVGGDFYDFFRLDDSSIGVVVADVSGKGVPSALFMVMVRTVMQATTRYLRSPGSVLSSVNNFLEDNNAEELFVTLFYGVLDERTGVFTYANGGHNPPVTLDADGEVRTLETTGGIVLGMFPGFEFQEAQVTLEPGTRLVLLTDGVTEAFNSDSEAFGDDRLIEVVRRLPDQSVGEDIDAIISAVHRFTGEAPQFDDITCVVLHYRGLSNEAGGGVLSPQR